MRSRRFLNPRSLTVRLIAGFTAVILLTLLAVGIPTLWLVRTELEEQVKARLDQGAHSTQAVFDARLREVQAIVNLTAERPTLRQLVVASDRTALASYLETIRSTSGLDFLVVLNPFGDPLGSTSLPAGLTVALLGAVPSGGIFPDVARLSPDGAPRLALRGRAVLVDATGAALGQVIGGMIVDDRFAATLRDETALEHILYSDQVPAANTLGGAVPRLDRLGPGQVMLGGTHFFVRQITLAPGVVDAVALPVEDVLATEWRVVQVLLVSGLAFAGLAILLGYVLARRVTAPLTELSAASEAIGRGDWTTPIPVVDSVAEISVMARTLERMRSRLRNAYEELASEKNWAEHLIGSLVEGVLTVDQAGRITSFSPGAERILGWRATDVVGRSFGVVFQITASAEGLSAPPTHLPAGTVLRQAVTARDGRQLVLLITSGATTEREDGTVEQALVFRDVTEEEEAERLREFFLANVSHELKTPLSSLRASVELLATELPSLTRAEQSELVNSLWLGTIRLEELVGNLLSSASIRSGQFEVRLRPVELDALIEEALVTTRPLLQLRKQHLQIELPNALPRVWADPRRLNQVFANLISNASKYGPPGAAIKVRAQRRKQQVLVQVIDSGPGISPELLPLLFQPFSRSGDPSRGGVGLGLSIVRTIVERQGGETGASSAPGKGSTFWFTLNIVDEAMVTQAPSLPGDQPNATRQHRV